MTDKKITKIQRRNASLPVMALLSLVMTGASVFCMAFPYVKKFDELLFYCFTGVGVIGLLYFSYMFASTIYRIIIPQNALVMDESGFCDYTVCNVGTGFVSWNNVLGIKVFGPENAPLLGITVSSLEELDGVPSDKVYREFAENAKTGVPEIIIKQSDIKIPLRQLERAMKRAAGGAEKEAADAAARTVADIYGIEMDETLVELTREIPLEAAAKKKMPASDDKAVGGQQPGRPQAKEASEAEKVCADDKETEAGAQNTVQPTKAKGSAEAEKGGAGRTAGAGSGEKSIDDLLKELADTLKAPSDKSRKNAREDYGKKLEEILSMLKEEDGEKRGER